MEILGKRIRSNPEYRKTYDVWYAMMNRCYNPLHPRYDNYGGSGVTVCDRWHEYNDFLEDIDSVQGFEYDKYISGNLALDKDSLCEGNKVYCLDKCVFITREENNKYKPNQQRLVLGIDPQGEKHEFTNQSEFARLNNLRQSSIGDCLSGKCKTHRKWKFKYIN